ncbi:MAG: hypothetical protein FJ008_08665 [Chloroflexi bacterium]|nr:hypothetical protein [Chloroflexota bacterium]MBM4451342.1 hypothetical protein [Chloroflexota bacterium]
MLDVLIASVRRAVPDGFVDIHPDIPWMSPDLSSEVIDLRRKYLDNPDIPDPPWLPEIFVDPSMELSEQEEWIGSEVKEGGTEALAWYVSFHQSKRWGIYIRGRGLLFVASYFKRRDGGNDVNASIKPAFDILLYHELFHFLTDITSAHMEMIYRQPVYNKYLAFMKSVPTAE